MGLTSSVPNSILQPGVCTSTTRPAAPYQGQVVYETDTNKTLFYNGTAWVILNDPNAVSTDASGNVTFDNDVTVSGGATVGGDLTVTGNMTSANQGLVLITPSSVSGGTLSGATVNVAGSTAVDIRGVFSSDYDVYKVEARFWNGSSTLDVYYRWIVGTSAVSSTNYWWSYLGRDYLGASKTTETTSANVGFTGTTCNTATDTVSFMDATISHPADSTLRSGFMSSAHCNDSSVFFYRTGAGGHRNIEAHDGIQFRSNSAVTFYATIRFYGYGK